MLPLHRFLQNLLHHNPRDRDTSLFKGVAYADGVYPLYVDCPTLLPDYSVGTTADDPLLTLFGNTSTGEHSIIEESGVRQQLLDSVLNLMEQNNIMARSQRPTFQKTKSGRRERIVPDAKESDCDAPIDIIFVHGLRGHGLKVILTSHVFATFSPPRCGSLSDLEVVADGWEAV